MQEITAAIKEIHSTVCSVKNFTALVFLMFIKISPLCSLVALILTHYDFNIMNRTFLKHRKKASVKLNIVKMHGFYAL